MVYSEKFSWTSSIVARYITFMGVHKTQEKVIEISALHGNCVYSYMLSISHTYQQCIQTFQSHVNVLAAIFV